jgi:AcrR family transcriptional regulator
LEDELLLDFCQSPWQLVSVARRPVQARAQERRDSLLDALSRLLDREGFARVNTNAIAAEAGAAVGTVYDYFPNKEAILEALLERYQRRLEAALLGALSTVDDDLDTLITAGVQAYAHFYETEPGYAALWLGAQVSAPLLEAGAAWGREFAALAGPLLIARAGLSDTEAARVALALVHAVSAVVTLALGQSPAEREKLVGEAVRMARAYVHAVADGSAGPPGLGPR